MRGSNRRTEQRLVKPRPEGQRRRAVRKPDAKAGVKWISPPVRSPADFRRFEAERTGRVRDLPDRGLSASCLRQPLRMNSASRVLQNPSRLETTPRKFMKFTVRHRRFFPRPTHLTHRAPHKRLLPPGCPDIVAVPFFCMAALPIDGTKRESTRIWLRRGSVGKWFLQYSFEINFRYAPSFRPFGSVVRALQSGRCTFSSLERNSTLSSSMQSS